MAHNSEDCRKGAPRSNNQSKLRSLRKTSPVDIEFQDINYSVRNWRTKSASTRILKSLNGKFCAGELTAILGPSGSGKTTLLNVLAGYVLDGVTGSIKINGKPRQMRLFNKLSAYIMEEDLLPSFLTVEELVMVAAKLKLGDSVSLQEKQLIANEVISSLGLNGCKNTRTEDISGGERRRLTIALELVNNPPVIFLDEPTSGLDTFAVKLCIKKLKLLTKQGRTVICTIHQPSDSVMQLFDLVYFIANGMCVYNGSTSNIVPFLSSVGLPCPITYSPAEYVIELQHDEYISVMTTGTQNGKVIRRIPQTSEELKSSSIREMFGEIATQKEEVIDFPTSFWTQFYILFSRMMLQKRRNKLMITVQLLNHLICGVAIGAIFFGIGNNGAMSMVNYRFNVCVMCFFLFTYLMVPVLSFPLEIKILKREYFNRWYSLKAYFVAITLQNLPLFIISGPLFLLIAYLMSNQPPEFIRFFKLLLASTLTVIASEGFGLVVGSTFNLKNGSMVAPATATPTFLLSVYGMGHGNAIHPFMEVIVHLSYMRHTLVAFSLALFANRPSFACSEEEVYCFYKEPKHLLRDLGMLDSSYTLHIIGLSLFILFYWLLAYFSLRHRLSAAFSRRKNPYNGSELN